jgi:hypothetical protein
MTQTELLNRPTEIGHALDQVAPVTNASELAARFNEHPWLEEEAKKDPHIIGAILRRPLESDVWIYRIVVLALGLAVLTSIAASTLIAWNGATPPEGLVAIGSAAVGALAGLLAPSPRANAN